MPTEPELAAAAREPAPLWLTLPLCLVIALAGLALVVNFRGIPERIHNHMTGGKSKGVLDSFDFQRFIGAWLALGGVGGLLGGAWELLR